MESVDAPPQPRAKALDPRRPIEAFNALRVGGGPAGVAVTFGLHVATGFIAVAVHYGAMWLLLRAGLPPIAASAGGFVGGAATRFALSYFGVFVPTRGVAVATSRFVIAIALQLLLNSALLAVLMQAGLPVWHAQVTATVLLTVVNFIVYRLWVFR